MLRDYQARAIEAVQDHWAHGTSTVCLVSPTGSGKTVMGAALAAGYQRVLWLAHRVELVEQARRAAPHAYVTTVQSLLASGEQPEVDLVVLDEAHHYVADEWRSVVRPCTRVVGLTATPQRGDGKALGWLFGALVVAAQYSELLSAGHIVPCRVFGPQQLGERSLALHPREAWERYGEGRQTFVFCSSYAAMRWALEEWPEAEGISASTPSAERADSLARFRAGELRALVSVQTLTEGVDVPEASCVILAGNVTTIGGYLQRVGRVLRPAAGKSDAIVIDLVGAVYRYGLPTDDREYTLEGDGIARATLPSLTQCLQCGGVSLVRVCPLCGFSNPVRDLRGQVIRDEELIEHYQGRDTLAEIRERALQRLIASGASVSAIVQRYKSLFGVPPRRDWVTVEMRAVELRRLTALAASRGFKPGWAFYRYEGIFK